MNRAFIDALVVRWRRAVYGREMSLAVGAGCLAAAGLALSALATLRWVGAAAVAIFVLALRLARSRPWRIDAASVAGHLDRTHPELEESASLFLQPPERLNIIERMQRSRAAQGWEARQGADAGKPPRRFLDAAIFGGVAALVLVVTELILHASGGGVSTDAVAHRPKVDQAVTAPAPSQVVLPHLTKGEIVVTPPAYTELPARTVTNLNTEVEEGASLTWTIVLDRPVREARLVFGEGATGSEALAVQAAGSGVELRATRRITDPGLYHLNAVLPDGAAWNPPELYALKVIKDRAPQLRIVQPAAARTEVTPPVPPAPSPRVEVEVEASDDYGLGDTRIVATVAKGSGEAVKFREVPLEFNSDPTAGERPRTRRFTRTLDLGALGLEPGDELYFFVQCYDNRQPVPNRTRSETRFVTLRGPQEKAMSTGKGVTGVNLVPEYFRSERQIIIDTEKLIAERPNISDRAFRERSNELGIDQQLLRLRYGQLLGEEMEGGNSDHADISLNPLERTAPDAPAGPRAAASITQRFLQEHEDRDRQGGSEEQREAGLRPDHPDAPLPAGAIVAPFVDQHDSQDKSTYYDANAKGTMRDALAAMWDAEKFLRVAQPQQALAPENRALEILKNLQQSARAYVQHIGFEPPPLKVDERRLKGDATEVPSRGSVADVPPIKDPAARAAREALPTLPETEGTLSAETVAALRAVEPALTAAATRQPEIYLAGLQALRRLVVAGPETSATTAELTDLRRALLRVLPAARALPERGAERDPSLGRLYFSTLRAGEQR